MKSRESHWIVASLENRLKQGADAVQIADIVILNWQLTETILNPIIGQKNVSSLYQRSLFLTYRIHPWLINAYSGIDSLTNLAALKSVVMQQSSANAVASGGAFLQTFYEMLISLIGSALTESLLRSGWENHLSGPSAQGSRHSL